jgi:DNA-binding NarL/FixJ family response regulator
VIRMSEKEKEQARRDYLADESVTYRQLAAEYGVSESQMLRTLAPVARGKGRPKASLTTEQMLRMRESGLTLYEIARQAGITESGVHRRLSRYNGNREAS